jgi:hypothetical protein
MGKLTVLALRACSSWCAQTGLPFSIRHTAGADRKLPLPACFGSARRTAVLAGRRIPIRTRGQHRKRVRLAG